MKATGTELVKRAAVAAFLGSDPEEIDRLISEDNLPHVKVPGKERPGIRIFLPDFHQWLVARSRLSPRLKDFAEFKRAFFAAQPPRKERGAKAA